MKTLIEWREATKVYGSTHALDRVSLSLAEGEILGILGPSGSGKSTLLRVTAGLEDLTAGHVLDGRRDLAGTAPHKRGFGLMFQDYSLFPHLTVGENVAFGLRMQRWGEARRRARVDEMLRLVRLPGLARRSVVSLSGGEQQRVALARSLAPSPRLLMLDEPLGAIDAALKGELLGEITDILREVGLSTVYVTHDQDEAMAVSSRVALLDKGRLIQVGSPQELVRNPSHRFTAAFLGLGALLPGTPRQTPAGWIMETELGDIPVSRADDFTPEAASPGDWALLVRPAAIRFVPGPSLVRASARLLRSTTTASGAKVRIGLRGREGTEFPIECALPAPGLSGTGMRPPGTDVVVWLDAGECQPVSP